MRAFGSTLMFSTLRRVLVKKPADAAEDPGQWRGLGWSAPPDLAAAASEHARLCELLEDCGAAVEGLPRNSATGLDSIYPHDPLLVTPRGTVLCRMGKEARRGEPEAAAGFVDRLGVPRLGAIVEPGILEGGDVVWLDEETLAVGEGYRTNAEGIRQLAELLGDSVRQVLAVPLPHWTGPNDCLHLMSLLSPLDERLLLADSRLLPVPFREELRRRGFELVEVAEGETPSLACNVLAVSPRRVLMAEGFPATVERLEGAGVEVLCFSANEICRKGGGGPTCLTRPLLRR